jgi:hypothetical protein
MAPVGGKPAHERRADSYRKTSGGYVANAIIHPRLWSIPRPGRRRFDPLRPFAAVVRMDEIVYDEEHVRLAVPIVADLKFDGKTYVLYDGESTNCYGEGRSYEEAVRMFSSEFLCKYEMALRSRRGSNSFCDAVALHVQGTEEEIQPAEKTESSGRIRSESKRKQSDEEGHLMIPEEYDDEYRDDAWPAENNRTVARKPSGRGDEPRMKRVRRSDGLPRRGEAT